MNHWKRSLCSALCVLVPAALLAAPPNGDLCPGGVAVDDGTFEDGYKVALTTNARMVQLLQPPAAGALLTKACVCWKSLELPTLNYNLVVYNNDGPDGLPGTLLASKPVTVTDVTVGAGQGGTFGGHDCADLGVLADADGLYVGAHWNPSGNDFFLCSDETPGTPMATSYRSGDGGSTWENLSFAFGEYRALGIRATFAGGEESCVPSPTSLCLRNGRFRVQANWRDFEENSGTANVVRLTDETGYLWFFAETNVEVVVKILDACSFTNTFWVFAGGLTSVDVDLTITDMQTGFTKVYSNELGVPFAPIQDTGALPTCP